MSETATAAKTIACALIGNPNTGKSTLFNALSGMNTRVGNFPGVTVEAKLGKTRHGEHTLQLIDLPGTYSLSPRSQDEMVSIDVLTGHQSAVPNPEVVVCLADASNLERNLYLFSQLLDLELPVVLVLNMWDNAESQGVRIDVEALQEQLGVPVVTTVAHRREGLDDLKQAIVAAVEQHRPSPTVRFPEPVEEALQKLHDTLPDNVPGERILLLRGLMDIDGEAEHRLIRKAGPDFAQHLKSARDSLQEQGLRVPVIESRTRYEWIRSRLDGVVDTTARPQLTVSDRIDRVLTHRFAGLFVFALTMLLVFQAIYSWAGPLMELIEGAQGGVAASIESVLAPGILRSLLVDGVVAGVGSVLVFLPQIALLFLFIAMLEDCGYMARAAFLADRLMAPLGLSGRSFVPLMSSFACAIPGIMATRVIDSYRDRMVTILIAPLMSCSARLPVYLLLTTAFVPDHTYLGGWVELRGLVLFAMHVVGLLVAIPVAWLLRKTFFRGSPSLFVLEMPSFKWPSPHIVGRRVYDQSSAFVVRAGTLIFCTTVVVWAAGFFPGDHSELYAIQSQLEAAESPDVELTEEEIEELEEQQRQVSGRLIATSYLGRFGHAIEPALRPLGWDWRIGVAAIASFPAREVVIAALGTIFSLGGDVEPDDAGLIDTLQSATWPDGSPLFTIPVAFSIMVFFALCSQCGATLMVIKRETNSWRWPIVTFAYMTGLAYLAAIATYQFGTWLMAA